MLRESYSPWVPNEQESSILEGTLAVPCQGKFCCNSLVTLQHWTALKLRSKGIVKPGSNMLYECRPAMPRAQSFGPELFSE